MLYSLVLLRPLPDSWIANGCLNGWVLFNESFNHQVCGVPASFNIKN